MIRARLPNKVRLGAGTIDYAELSPGYAYEGAEPSLRADLGPARSSP
jgi:hypothetical protein